MPTITSAARMQAGTRPSTRAKPKLPTFAYEAEAIASGYRMIAGIDEAGRGPWAGPVVAAAVILDPANIPAGIADSKQLTEEKRECIFEELLVKAKVGVAFADTERIDRDNILAATLWSMHEAVSELDVAPDYALVDGNRSPTLDCKAATIVKGDSLSLSIAAASIAAKVTRDRMMKRFEQCYPGYGFARHKGYGTAIHREALNSLGACPLHRRSFKPVRDVIAAWENSTQH